MIDWINRFRFSRCANCGNLRLCKRYWFKGDGESWNKLMCRGCHKQMITMMKNLRGELLKKVKHDP